MTSSRHKSGKIYLLHPICLLCLAFFGIGCANNQSASDLLPTSTADGPDRFAISLDSLLGSPQVFDPQVSSDGRVSVSMNGTSINLKTGGENLQIPVPRDCPALPADLDRRVWLKPDGGFIYGEYCLADSSTKIYRYDPSGTLLGSKVFPGGIGLDISGASGKAVFYVASSADYAFVVTGLDGSDPVAIEQSPNPGDAGDVPLLPGVMRFSATGKKLFYTYRTLQPIEVGELEFRTDYVEHHAVYDLALGKSTHQDAVYPPASDTEFLGWLGDSILVIQDSHGLVSRFVLE